MPSEQIHVLEAIIYRIELERKVHIHDKEGLSVNFKFSQKVNFDIDSMYFSPPQIESGSNKRNIDMNYGKTFVFVAKPTDLKQLMQIEPYQITLMDGNTSIGTASAHWNKEFLDIVKRFDGKVKSASVEDWYEITNDKGDKTGRLKMFIRMSCFGNHIETMFHIKEGEGTKPEYLFLQRDESKTFKVARYRGDHSMYSEHGGIDAGEHTSLHELYSTAMMKPAFSDYDGSHDDIDLDMGSFSDVVSLCIRPSENKFFDFLNVFSAEVKTHAKGTCITLQKSKSHKTEPRVKSFGGGRKRGTVVVVEEEEDSNVHTTADEINQKLCKNKDCPAVRKFKEYGIGPLANEDNVGELEPSVTYGMSHFNNTTDNYGPYGVFSRPKCEELPFVPLQVVSEPVKPCKQRKVVNPDCSKKPKTGKKKKNPKWHSESCPLCPEKLKGDAKKCS